MAIYSHITPRYPASIAFQRGGVGVTETHPPRHYNPLPMFGLRVPAPTVHRVADLLAKANPVFLGFIVIPSNSDTVTR